MSRSTRVRHGNHVTDARTCQHVRMARRRRTALGGDGVERGGLDAVADILGSADPAVLSGAGISTESGIPDYRGPASARRDVRPITYQEFVRDAAARRRYWARSFAGWPFMAARRPNAGHRAVAALEAAGLVSGVVTQNVDGLHQEAGSREVVELHGSLREVRCLSCGTVEARASLQERLAASNQGFLEAAPRYAPDDPAVEQWRQLRGEYLVSFYRELRAALPGKEIITGIPRGRALGPPYGNLQLDWEGLARARLVDGLVLGVRSGAGLHPPLYVPHRTIGYRSSEDDQIAILIGHIEKSTGLG